jgi:hypothetical protein
MDERKVNDPTVETYDPDPIVAIPICFTCQQYLTLPTTTLTLPLSDTTSITSSTTSENTDTVSTRKIVLNRSVNDRIVQLHLLPVPVPVPQHTTISSFDSCSICLGVWTEAFTTTLVSTIHDASTPYNANNNDHSNDNEAMRMNQTPRDIDSQVDQIQQQQQYRNRYSRQRSPPTMVLPGDIIYRYVLVQHLLTGACNYSNDSENTKRTKSASNTSNTAINHIKLQDYVTELKQYTKRIMNDCCNILEVTTLSSSNDNTDIDDYYNIEYPNCIINEELGYLTFHVIVIPNNHTTNQPLSFIHCINQDKMKRSNRTTKKQRMMKQNNNHIVTNNETETYIEQTQGGDPRINFEQRFIQQQQQHERGIIWSINHAMEQLPDILKYLTSLQQQRKEQPTRSNIYLDHIQNIFSSSGNYYDSNNNKTTLHQLSCYASVWRRPFYIRGMYTKIYRTISQTPFFVVDDIVVDNESVAIVATTNDTQTTTHGTTTIIRTRTKKRSRLGTTSVEEVITPYIIRATKGIATHNNTISTNTNVNNNNNSNNFTNVVVYGMAKFHASGREDMNVRMLLPLPIDQSVITDNRYNGTVNNSNSHHNASDKITGRPFVYEIYDAIRLPRIHDLINIVSSINHIPLVKDILINGGCSTNNKSQELQINQQRRSYGNNPLGVDISPELVFVPSSSFKRLQEETEHKIKYYECYCWSELSIRNIIILLKQQLDEQELQRIEQNSMSNASDHEKSINELLFDKVTFPIEIQQKTPIRVLHRRTNMIRSRYIYSCRIQLDCTSHDIDRSNHPNNFYVTTEKQDEQHYFIVHLSTSAGTYVKEFIHGDLNRTIPNLSSMFGCRTDILELDCTGIQS